MVGRVGKQCRKQWNNHPRPHIKKDVWTEDEERWLIQAHERLGNQRAAIAKYIPGRTENSTKNHWNATKRSNGFASTNSDFGTTTTAANPSNAGTPLSDDEDSTPFFVEGTSENTYSFNVDENYNHPTIFFTSTEILQTTDSQLPAVEYCRERWNNHLLAHIKDACTEDEERRLIQAHERLGNRWVEIAKYIPGRTKNSIKNHWIATKRRQISRRKRKKVKGDRRQSTLLQDYIIKKYFGNGSTSTNSNFGATTTAANLSNAGTPLSDDYDSTPFFGFESCNDEMDFMKTLFENNQSIVSIPVDHR
ncbi:transcription factor MYB64-like [Olea europaea var. sylvestris]|uniref:transcription factor MYB64-like n=1 Tax=Olea europaea var. sylvestris TaxID=158386 RepID=UPI000C1CFB66|nr:transcription factor MYB64-like [Olea europaea var. sylvestris]